MCTGCFNDYYVKFTLGRLLAVRKIDHGTISWWPTMCPAYQDWYKRLYPGKKPVARGTVPSSVHDLHYIEPVQDV